MCKSTRPRLIKVCFFHMQAYSLFFGGKNIHGGSEVQLYYIAQEMAKTQDFKVSFVVGDYGQKKIITWAGIQIIKGLNPKQTDPWFVKIINALKYLQILNRIDADVYITSSANAAVGIIAIFCKIFGKVHIHRTSMHIETTKQLTKGLLGRMYKLGLRNATRIITQLEEHKENIWRYHKLQSIVVRNGFPITTVKKNRKKTFILWVSRYTGLKNPHIFLDLARQFPSEPFVMVCPCADPNDVGWQNLLNEAKKIKNLRFIPHVPFNEIQTIFDHAKLFVNTSSSEGFPNTFIQAGLGRTPLLSLSVNPDNIINRYGCGKSCNGRKQRLTTYLNSLLRNKNRLKAYGDNCYQYVRHFHNIKTNAATVIMLSRKLAQKNTYDKQEL